MNNRNKTKLKKNFIYSKNLYDKKGLLKLYILSVWNILRIEIGRNKYS